jgi:hypothetical protein
LTRPGTFGTPTSIETLKWKWSLAEIKRFVRKHEEQLHHHDNVEAIQLLDNSELLRRLNRTKSFQLAN